VTTPLVIIGCGGFGREVHDVVDAINAHRPTWNLLGYLDDMPNPENQKLVDSRGSSVLGGTDWLLSARMDVSYVIGIGTGSVRRAIDERLSAAGYLSAILIHPSVTLGHGVIIQPGTVICAGARLTTHIDLGRHTHIDQNATIGHDARVGDYARLNPQACVSGSVVVGDGCLVGANATVLQGIVIGDFAVVGAGAVVTKDVEEHLTVKGVPAR